MTDAEISSAKSIRPWWRDPVAICFSAFIFLACAGILAKGWIAPPKPVDPAKPAALPGGSSFCDTPAPAKSTLERPAPLPLNQQH